MEIKLDIVLSNIVPSDAILLAAWLLQIQATKPIKPLISVELLDLSTVNRSSERPFELNLRLLSNFIKELQIPIKLHKIDASEELNLELDGSYLVSDFSAYRQIKSQIKKQKRHSTVTIVTSMADLLIATQSKVSVLHNPWKLEARKLWCDFLDRLEVDCWLMPPIYSGKRILRNQPIISFNSCYYSQATKLFFDIYCSESVLGGEIQRISDREIAVISFGSRPSLKQIKSIQSRVKWVLGSNFQYVVKTHPNSILGSQITDQILTIFGADKYLVTNYFDNPELRALPLEVLLFALPNSFYFGTYTGGVHSHPKDRIKFVSNPLSKEDFLLRNSYGPFLKILNA